METDLDRLKSIKLPAPSNSSEPSIAGAPQLKALIIEFSLAPSQYATMAIREIVKASTTASYQASSNNGV